MKRVLLTLVGVAALSAVTGCCCPLGPCGTGAVNGAYAGAPDNSGSCAATGAITYPYYTCRGPRDFLATDPRSIGP